MGPETLLSEVFCLNWQQENPLMNVSELVTLLVVLLCSSLEPSSQKNQKDGNGAKSFIS